VLDADSETDRYYGRILALLYKKGRPIPTNDVWIAATALQHNLTLITRDNHFAEIAKLKIKEW
jgi:tRNA(fMet)-specific endonuclease VapC